MWLWNVGPHQSDADGCSAELEPHGEAGMHRTGGAIVSSTNRGAAECKYPTKARPGADNPGYRHGFACRGIKRSREYRIWGGMCSRCHNPNCRLYYAYGARGIRVCEAWRGLGGFELFLAHIGTAPSSRHSVERIDNDRGYEPGNVRWATQREQCRNTRRTHWVKIRGERRSLIEWCELAGLNYKMVHSRWRRGHDVVAELRAALEAA